MSFFLELFEVKWPKNLPSIYIVMRLELNYILKTSLHWFVDYHRHHYTLFLGLFISIFFIGNKFSFTCSQKRKKRKIYIINRKQLEQFSQKFITDIILISLSEYIIIIPVETKIIEMRHFIWLDTLSNWIPPYPKTDLRLVYIFKGTIPYVTHSKLRVGNLEPPHKISLSPSH